MAIVEVIASVILLVDVDFESVVLSVNVEKVCVPQLECAAVHVGAVESNDHAPSIWAPVLFWHMDAHGVSVSPLAGVLNLEC